MLILSSKLNMEYYLDNISLRPLLLVFVLLLTISFIILIILCSEGQSQTGVSQDVSQDAPLPFRGNRPKQECKHV